MVPRKAKIATQMYSRTMMIVEMSLRSRRMLWRREMLLTSTFMDMGRFLLYIAVCCLTLYHIFVKMKMCDCAFSR